MGHDLSLPNAISLSLAWKIRSSERAGSPDNGNNRRGDRLPRTLSAGDSVSLVRRSSMQAVGTFFGQCLAAYHGGRFGLHVDRLSSRMCRGCLFERCSVSKIASSGVCPEGLSQEAGTVCWRASSGGLLSNTKTGWQIHSYNPCWVREEQSGRGTRNSS